MNRAFALIVPFAFLLTACPPGNVGDKCDEDDDCDTENGLVCDLGEETGEDAEGVCGEENPDVTEE